MDRALSIVRFPLSVVRPVALAVIAVLLMPVVAWACPVCYGSPDDPLVKATNNGIWVLLGFIAFVQIGFVALFITFWRRAKAQQRFKEQFHVVK